MIQTSRQLKALVRNLSKGDSLKAQTIIRNYVMERFFERLALSSYRNNLILKGGTLVAAMVGLDNRSTMDIDATLKNLPLSEESIRKVVEEITSVQIDDGMTFEIKSIVTIMNEADYPGIRVKLDATLEKMHTPLKIDFSIGDIITPNEMAYSFRLLFEERIISILAYNLETVLAEKLETLLSRGIANTRMRDFYDIYALESTQDIDYAVLRAAFVNTTEKRGSATTIRSMDIILDEVESDLKMVALWNNYKHKFVYAADIGWSDIMQAVRKLCNTLE